jgi:predicted unusual protein kinase regulating ubiquinone biosynthesis (AarF/ABC1/UbiB family)
MFDDFNERPIASGSIAQVYKARLDGHDVAVKVRHPHVVENIRLDFKGKLKRIFIRLLYKLDA